MSPPFSSRVRWLESPTGRTLQKIFRFLADRGTQLEYVERIDEEKGLPE